MGMIGFYSKKDNREYDLKFFIENYRNYKNDAYCMGCRKPRVIGVFNVINRIPHIRKEPRILHRQGCPLKNKRISIKFFQEIKKSPENTERIKQLLVGVFNDNFLPNRENDEFDIINDNTIFEVFSLQNKTEHQVRYYLPRKKISMNKKYIDDELRIFYGEITINSYTKYDKDQKVVLRTNRDSNIPNILIPLNLFFKLKVKESYNIVFIGSNVHFNHGVYLEIKDINFCKIEKI
ncbi:hypothetical protein [Psychrilyobacter atlanticus]|uniref:hypothetical protein n=1 Tax=Psychrilyobacter atlanticus TaxID=271091 RepID=UPI00042A6DD8|nr:hypothetical protein [Psychrilyobacter atlanticus]